MLGVLHQHLETNIVDVNIDSAALTAAGLIEVGVLIEVLINIVDGVDGQQVICRVFFLICQMLGQHYQIAVGL